VPVGFENVSEYKPPIQISKQEGFHHPGNAIASTSVTHEHLDANFVLQDIA
jgi:hypothetical protein